MINSKLLCVAGLPRSGSTLLCQLLAMHPDIDCEGMSSPVLNTLLGIRRMISDDPFYLAQLDERFEQSYDHLLSANRGFLRGWYGQVNAKVVVDKNRAWLQAIEYLDQLDPSARVLVCVRELGQVYASIEAQHQRTLMLDFVDHLADLDRMGRADQLFSKERAIGAPLLSIQALVDLPGQIKKKLYFVKYEDLVRDPQKVMSSVCEWLGLNRVMIGTEKLKLGPRESDSHYRFKYLHTQYSSLKKAPQHAVPPRIQAHIEKAFAWYYETFYPSMRSPS